MNGQRHYRRILGDGTSCYHCVSRIVDKRFIFGDEEKEYFHRTMRALETAMGARVLTYCIMSNHFHLLLRVPGEDEIVPAEEVSDAEVVRMVKALNGKEAAISLLKAELRDLESAGLPNRRRSCGTSFSIGGGGSTSSWGSSSRDSRSGTTGRTTATAPSGRSASGRCWSRAGMRRC